MDDIEDGGLGHIAPLGADTVPDVNQAHYCFSCTTPINGEYCAACGQKNDDFRRSIFSLIKETLGTIFGFESRIWSTWGTLLVKPGKVAREYSDGARAKWSSPVRVYIAMSIILFGYLAFFGIQIFSLEIDASLKDGVDTTQPFKSSDIDINFKSEMFVRKKDIQARNESRDFDLISKWMNNGFNISIGEDAKDSLDDALEELEDAQIPNDLGKKALADFKDGLKAGMEAGQKDAVEDSKVEGPEDDAIEIGALNGNSVKFSNQELSNFVLSVIRNPETINRGLFKYLPRLMFFMMPFSMLIGAVFIRGKRALLFDHLVHSAYIHGVMFLLILIGVVFGPFVPGSFLPVTLTILMTLYLPISLKRMFGRGWFKTILTSYSVAFIYMLTIFIAMILIIGMDATETIKAQQALIAS